MMDWVRVRRDAVTGIETIRAHFEGHAYDPHSHEQYLVGVTEEGVQEFPCRRQVQRSTAGRVILMEPGEAHDGRAPHGASFRYLGLYLPQAWLSRELGFRAVATGDHFVTPARIDSPYPYTKDRVPWVRPEAPTPDPMVLAGVVAQATRRLRLFVTSYVLPMRDPFAAAKAISSAAVLSDNRLVLGVGIGWMREEFALVGQDFATRGRRCDS